MPRVTVLLSTFDRRLGFETAARSLLEQSFADWQCVICDDASSDSWEAFELACEDRRFSLLRGPRIPPKEKRDLCTFGRLLNQALEITDSEFVTYLADCAEYRPHRLAQQRAYLDDIREAHACWGQQEMIWYDDEGCVKNRRECFPDGSIARHQGPDFISAIIASNFIDHSSLLERRESVSMTVPWSVRGEDWPRTDWMRWQLAAQFGFRFDFVGAIVGEVKHVTPDSLGARIAAGETIEQIATDRGQRE